MYKFVIGDQEVDKVNAFVAKEMPNLQYLTIFLIIQQNGATISTPLMICLESVQMNFDLIIFLICYL